MHLFLVSMPTNNTVAVMRSADAPLDDARACTCTNTQTHACTQMHEHTDHCSDAKPFHPTPACFRSTNPWNCKRTIWPHQDRTKYVQGTSRPRRPRRRPKMQWSASPSGRRAAGHIGFRGHFYKERFGHLGHDNARRRSRLHLRAAVCIGLGPDSDKPTQATTTPGDAADCTSERPSSSRPHRVWRTSVQGTSWPSRPRQRPTTQEQPFALRSDEICTRKAIFPGAPFPSRACF